MPCPFFHTAVLSGRATARRAWLSFSALVSTVALVLLSLDMPPAG
ncbi:MAG TPA: hypothetical protein QGG32_04605 [Rhodospirillales bacterium]|jgi:hypothetical protein|nr:hypothetical protein [Rhodospirillales bacterium]